jgi:hypothetical protein
MNDKAIILVHPYVTGFPSRKLSFSGRMELEVGVHNNIKIQVKTTEESSRFDCQENLAVATAPRQRSGSNEAFKGEEKVRLRGNFRSGPSEPRQRSECQVTGNLTWLKCTVTPLT